MMVVTLQNCRCLASRLSESFDEANENKLFTSTSNLLTRASERYCGSGQYSRVSFSVSMEYRVVVHCRSGSARIVKRGSFDCSGFACSL